MVLTLRAAFVVCAVVALPVASGEAVRQRQGEADPFSFFQPVVTLSPGDRQRVDRGEILVRILPARGGEVAVFAATRLDADEEALVRWTRAIEALKRGPFVQAVHRFSEPPVLSDVDGLSLDEGDLETVRRCRIGDCGLKLAEHEIRSLRVAAAVGGADWRSSVQQEFRRLLLERIARYRMAGLPGLPANVDHSTPTQPGDAFAAIVHASPFLRSHLPAIADGLERYPHAALPGGESFLYWSKEDYGSGKPVIGLTQVHIVRPGGPPRPVVLVLGQEIFASHYRDGSLGITAVLEDDGGRYLVYLNRSRLDTLGGFLGGLKRSILEGRLASEVKPAIATVRRRLESGEPPVGIR